MDQYSRVNEELVALMFGPGRLENEALDRLDCLWHSGHVNFFSQAQSGLLDGDGKGEHKHGKHNLSRSVINVTYHRTITLLKSLEFRHI